MAVYSNVRTTIGAQRAGWSDAFNVAFRAGSVMGFALTGMAVLVLYIALWGYRQYFGDDVSGCVRQRNASACFVCSKSKLFFTGNLAPSPSSFLSPLSLLIFYAFTQSPYPWSPIPPFAFFFFFFSFFCLFGKPSKLPSSPIANHSFYIYIPIYTSIFEILKNHTAVRSILSCETLVRKLLVYDKFDPAC